MSCEWMDGHMMKPSKKANLDLINEHITCRLCSGYLIDAWTIHECLHSFCRACIFSYFDDDNEDHTACPVCSTVPHPGNPLLGISKDCWLQQLVYKLVPSLFKREMCQRRIFYDAHPDDKSKFLEQYTQTPSSQMGCREEELGELSERCLFQQKNNQYHQEEKIYLTLEYTDQEMKSEEKQIHFLECSSQMPAKILKQYLKKVLPLSQRSQYQIDLLFEQKLLLDNFTLKHVYAWKANQEDKQKYLHLFYRVLILERENEDPIKNEPIESNNEHTTHKDLSCHSIETKAPAFLRSSNISANPNSFVHTTPFTPAESKTISLNHSSTEQMPTNESIELIKPKECTLIDCKTFTNTTPINYSMESISDISTTKKRTKKSNSQETHTTKKCKVDKKKKSMPPQVPVLPPPLPHPSAPPELISDEPIVPPLLSENDNPNESKPLSYSEVIQEANKLLAAEEPMTPINHSVPLTSSSSSSVALSNPATSRLTKPIATVSPLHTSKTSNQRFQDKFDDDQLIDLSKSNVSLNSSSNDIPLKIEEKISVESSAPLPSHPPERKKRARQVSSSTTRTKVSRNSNKSNQEDQNDSTKSFKKTLSNMNVNQYLPPPPPTPQQQQQQQQQMFQNFFHSFQNQANYWPMSPWPVPPSLALMADPRNYYHQAWPPASPATANPSMHPPKDLSSVSLNDFIGESHASPSTLLNCASNFVRTTSSQSLHLHHTAANRHRPTAASLNGSLS